MRLNGISKLGHPTGGFPANDDKLTEHKLMEELHEPVFQVPYVRHSSIGLENASKFRRSAVKVRAPMVGLSYR